MHYKHTHTIDTDVETFWQLFFDPQARRYYLNAIPGFGADRIKMTNEIWTEPVGSNRIERHVSGEACGWLCSSMHKLLLQRRNTDEQKRTVCLFGR
jgi:hypothetical protein